MSPHMSKTEQPNGTVFLGIECGATHSIAILTQDGADKAVQYEAGPANVRLLKDSELIAHFKKISAFHEKKVAPSAVAIAMAGARTQADKDRILKAAAKVWPGASTYATNDLETAIAAAEAPGGKQLTRVLILSGTGSCCFGRTVNGKSERVGGWGHFIGDKGSGYEIGLRALKAVVYYYDHDGVWPALGQRILRFLQLNEPNDLIGWVQNASKDQVASIAILVFAAWHKKDKIATDILEAAAASLACDGAACAAKLVAKGTPVQFVLAGSVLLKQPDFSKQIERQLKKLWPKAIVTPLTRASVWGAVELAKQHAGQAPSLPMEVRGALPQPPVTSSELPVTERRNPLSLNLDQLPIGEMIDLMLREDEKIPAALLNEKAHIEHAVRIITTAFKKGGRLFYIGAGTSGRLGVLDASECPPTFRTSPEMVQGIIAGGQNALWKAVEGAEDDLPAGARAIEFSAVTSKDVVVGIAASGRTPFVWGALIEARKRGAKTVLLCFNPHLKVVSKDRPTIIIAPDVGPEILTGSTRLKAGTATKVVLNMLTTLSMVKLGKVVSNLMIDMNPSNSKLRDRAVRIVQEITGAGSEAAKEALEKSKWTVKDACRRIRRSRRPVVSQPRDYQVCQTSTTTAGTITV
jgi:N-acetylmuramic acid 6-phosphate etherase